MMHRISTSRVIAPIEADVSFIAALSDLFFRNLIVGRSNWRLGAIKGRGRDGV